MAERQDSNADEEDMYDEYSDDFSDDEEEEDGASPVRSPEGKEKTASPPRKARVQGRGRGHGKGRGRGPGRQDQGKPEVPMDEVVKRLLSADQLRMKELRNQMNDMKKQLKAVKDENRLFKQVQYKQERALKRFEDTESQLPQLIQAHNNEVRSLREQLRQAKEKYEKTDRYLRDAEDELDKANSQLKRYKDLTQKKNLGERSDLDRRLTKAEESLEEKNSRMSELERHLEMVKKNHRHELGIERARAKETEKQIEEMKEEKARLETLVKEKEKQLEAQNIYSNRLLKPSSYGGTPAHTPPLWRQNLMKNSGSMTDLSFRDRAKAYEDKRRAERAEKKLRLPKLPTSPHKVMEKQAKSQELKQKKAEEEKEKDTAAETKPQRENSEAEFWRRQEERYKQEQLNREKQEEDQRRKEEDEARLREQKKLELQERERADRERRDTEERERRERERKEEMERKEKEEREREQKEREERERQEAEEEARKQREEALRAREEQERKEEEARQAEERRKKEELLRRLQKMDGSSDDPFAPSGSAKGKGGDPFAPSASKKTDYSFTQSIENLHKGKPSHDHVSVPYIDRQKKMKAAADDSDFGGYQPSFTTGPVKTVGMKEKKPLSLFDDAEPKPAATNPAAPGGTEKKSRLMADLFGSSDTGSDSKKNGDDLFLGNARPAARQPLQSKRMTGFPWDDAPPASNKLRATEKRESSALFGGGAAVIEDSDTGAGSRGTTTNSTVLPPRRPRPTATTFSSKPAVLAVDNFDDDIEEVVL
ncbi:uncharacterized protein LOC143282856 isoform X2 [Babylonia areolata]|uniref:uncharacterized protein LOC143282856 isoform X2 n=1 Tax=Babylonia areolata TaxID=304850 RepID=UPI003FD2CD2E